MAFLATTRLWPGAAMDKVVSACGWVSVLCNFHVSWHVSPKHLKMLKLFLPTTPQQKVSPSRVDRKQKPPSASNSPLPATQYTCNVTILSTRMSALWLPSPAAFLATPAYQGFIFFPLCYLTFPIFSLPGALPTPLQEQLSLPKSTLNNAFLPRLSPPARSLLSFTAKPLYKIHPHSLILLTTPPPFPLPTAILSLLPIHCQDHPQSTSCHSLLPELWLNFARLTVLLYIWSLLLFKLLCQHILLNFLLLFHLPILGFRCKSLFPCQFIICCVSSALTWGPLLFIHPPRAISLAPMPSVSSSKWWKLPKA